MMLKYKYMFDRRTQLLLQLKMHKLKYINIITQSTITAILALSTSISIQ